MHSKNQALLDYIVSDRFFFFERPALYFDNFVSNVPYSFGKVSRLVPDSIRIRIVGGKLRRRWRSCRVILSGELKSHVRLYAISSCGIRCTLFRLMRLLLSICVLWWMDVGGGTGQVSGFYDLIVVTIHQFFCFGWLRRKWHVAVFSLSNQKKNRD